MCVKTGFSMVTVTKMGRNGHITTEVLLKSCTGLLARRYGTYSGGEYGGFEMTLAEKLSTYDKKYWDFSEYRNDSPLVRYPAVMVAPMQACILKEIINSDATTSTVLDPFCGSGTVLCEAQKLGLNVMGFDINPLAVLIATVQLEGIPADCAVESINAVKTRLTMPNGNVKPYSFKNINKWFNDDIIVSLSVIRQAIIEETNDRMRRFFWCCFAETVKKFSNTRTSTFKLHVKEQSKIDATVDETITFFKEHIQNNYPRFIKNSTCSICVKCGDSKKYLSTIDADSVDLICTSPPYGDNHTTVTYGQFSILPLLWIDKKDLQIWDECILETFTAIDSASLGGRVKRKPANAHLYSEFVNSISSEKQKKVVAFLEDYEAIYSMLARVLKPGKLLVLTLGNRRVDNKEIAFDTFNDMLARKYGMELDSTITRNITGKRMPAKVSCIKEVGAVKSMSKEYVKIYRKGYECG